MMGVIFGEIKRRRVSFVVWCIVAVFLILATFMKAQAFVVDPSLGKVFDTMPREVLAIFGMQGLDITKYTGFYGVGFPYFAMLLVIFSISNIVSMFANEQKDKTSDYIYTRPVHRHILVRDKIIASFIMVTIINVLVMVTACLYASTLTEVNLILDVFIMHVNIYFMCLLFMGLAMVMMSGLKKLKDATKYSYFILFGTYFVYVIIGLVNESFFLEMLTPFSFLGPINVINATPSLYGYLLSCGVLILGYFFMLVKFEEREF